MAAERRLAAIMFTDIVGYTALMAESEERGLWARERHRQLVRPLVEKYHGEAIEAHGDESLSVFSSALDAVNCALAIHEALVDDARQLRLHIGLHLGEVVLQQGEVSGDGVNIASRICALASGDAPYVSDEVQHALQNQPSLRFDALGDHELKNVPRPVGIFRVNGASQPPRAGAVARPRRAVARRWTAAVGVLLLAAGAVVAWSFINLTREPDAQPGPPAIAVLAFENLGGDPEQEYLADGIAEDLTTRLARFEGFSVIARNSAFTYKGRSVDARQVSADLSARYLVEGSVRRAGTRIRISVQLIDAPAGTHLWAQTYDRELDDALVLQDDITQAIVAAIHPEVVQAEVERLLRQEPENLDAWDSFHRGLWQWNKFTREDNAEARQSFEKAIELEPSWSRPHAALALTHVIDITNGWTDSMERSAGEVMRAAQTAIALNPHDPVAQHAAGHAYGFSGEREKMIAAYAHAMDPTDALGSVCSGVHLGMAGRPEEAIGVIEEAIRLSPQDPVMPVYFRGMAYAHFAAERYEEAVAWAKRTLEHPLRFDDHAAYRILAASYVALGRVEEGRLAAREAKRLNPEYSLAYLRRYGDSYDPDFVQRFLEALHTAGFEG
jgi:TolB-like protein/class 3 adenylate cyclase/Flp pilus assembly protein TadD